MWWKGRSRGTAQKSRVNRDLQKAMQQAEKTTNFVLKQVSISEKP